MPNDSFYDINADDYFDATVGLDMSPERNRFTAALPSNGAVLDAGCGSGRDIQAFAVAGYRVKAFDASREMAVRATRLSGISVEVLRFAELKWEREFDGVWACASMVHLPPTDLEGALRAVMRALREGGVLYVSLKKGTGSYRDETGRHYYLHELAGVQPLLEATGFTLLSYWETGSKREASMQWGNYLCRKSNPQ